MSWDGFGSSSKSSGDSSGELRQPAPSPTAFQLRSQVARSALKVNWERVGVPIEWELERSASGDASDPDSLSGSSSELHLTRQKRNAQPSEYTQMTRLLLLSCLVAVTAGAQKPSSDEAAIRAARERSNRAIAAHNLDAAAAIWSADYVGVTSRNARSIGRDEERKGFAELLATRPKVVFVRTPTSIVVNAKWAQAGETGRWTGSWSDSSGVTRVGGVYFAKWRRENGEWKILAETFVQTTCSGTRYCDNPPAPQ